jgi:hypothetical protein
MMPKDNYFAAAANCFSLAAKALGRGAKNENPVMFYLLAGLLRMAEGLQRESEVLERTLAVPGKR